jgi:hypothetical protein
VDDAAESSKTNSRVNRLAWQTARETLRFPATIADVVSDYDALGCDSWPRTISDMTEMMICRFAASLSLLFPLLLCGSLPAAALASEILVEAESFDDRGGWKLDTQFIQQMGSPYLLAHGLGKPVKDATTAVEIPAAGTYAVWVRTFDWVARWQAPGTPGRFALLVNGSNAGR